MYRLAARTVFQGADPDGCQLASGLITRITRQLASADAGLHGRRPGPRRVIFCVDEFWPLNLRDGRVGACATVSNVEIACAPTNSSVGYPMPAATPNMPWPRRPYSATRPWSGA
jgi:hypothetical protein